MEQISCAFMLLTS